jgi:signal peptidase II
VRAPLWVKALLVPAVIAADQAMKWYTIQFVMSLASGYKELLPGVVRLVYVENRGAAFGMLQQARWFFILGTLAAIVFAVFAFWKRWIRGEFGQWAVMLVLSGALGNLIDRVRQGYVVDMFELEFIRFAIFNVADIFISAGGVLTCVYLVFFHEKHKRPAGE